MNTRLRYVQVVLLMAVVGCTNQTAETQKAAGRPVINQGGEVTLCVRLSAAEYASGEDIEMTVIVKNSGNTVVCLEEGGFRAIFLVGGEAKTFLQSVRASFASGHKLVKVNPGEVYKEQFIVHPKDWGEQRKLAPGQYRMRVCYSRFGSRWRPGVDRAPNQIEEGIVKSLDSEEIVIRIR